MAVRFREPERRVIVGGLDKDERMVHYDGAPGQIAGVLCGWDGGVLMGSSVDEPVECPECVAIVDHLAWLWGHRRLPRKPREKKP